MLVENHTAHATGVSGAITPPANKPALARLVRSANRESRAVALVGAAVVGDVAGAVGDHRSLECLSGLRVVEMRGRTVGKLKKHTIQVNFNNRNEEWRKITFTGTANSYHA